VAGIVSSGQAALALDDVVAEAIRVACDAHGATCDLTNPDSPSSTVAVVREREGCLDYLTLADSPIILDTTDGIQPVIDDRTARLPSYTREGIRSCRNEPGGFWVASTKPEAAYHAVRGSTALRHLQRVALLTDGAARYVERFNLGGWQQLAGVLEEHGPSELIRKVRQAEAAETESEREGRQGKRQDDATAVIVHY
jgi:hypothetical protein